MAAGIEIANSNFTLRFYRTMRMFPYSKCVLLKYTRQNCTGKVHSAKLSWQDILDYCHEYLTLTIRLTNSKCATRCSNW